MMKKYIENLEKAESACKAVLGDDINVTKVGSFYLDNSGLLDMISLHSMIMFYKSKDFSSQEAAAYRKGQEDFIDFMLACSEEYTKSLQREIKGVIN